MIKLLALDMDGTLLNEAKEIPQLILMPFIRAIEKVSNWFSVLVVLSLEFFPTTKTRS